MQSESLAMEISRWLRNSQSLTPSRVIMMRSVTRYPMLLSSIFKASTTSLSQMSLRLATSSSKRLLGILIGKIPLFTVLKPEEFPQIFSSGFTKQLDSSSHHFIRILNNSVLLICSPGAFSSSSVNSEVPSEILVPITNSSSDSMPFDPSTLQSTLMKISFIFSLNLGNCFLVSLIRVLSQILISLAKSTCLSSRPMSTLALLSMSYFTIENFLLLFFIFQESSVSIFLLREGGYLLIRNCKQLLLASLCMWQNSARRSRSLSCPTSMRDLQNSNHLWERLRASLMMSQLNLIFMSSQLILLEEQRSKQVAAVLLQKLPTLRSNSDFYWSTEIVGTRATTARSISFQVDLVWSGGMILIRLSVYLSLSQKFSFNFFDNLGEPGPRLLSSEGSGGRAATTFLVYWFLLRLMMLCFRDPVFLQVPESPRGSKRRLALMVCVFSACSLPAKSTLFRSKVSQTFWLMWMRLSNRVTRVSTRFDSSCRIFAFCLSMVVSNLLHTLSKALTKKSILSAKRSFEVEYFPVRNCSVYPSLEFLRCRPLRQPNPYISLYFILFITTPR